MDGGTILHIVGAQMGGKSIVLLQIGCISPLTHRQMQAASRGAICTKTTAAAEMSPSVILLLDKAMPPIVIANNGCAGIGTSVRPCCFAFVPSANSGQAKALVISRQRLATKNNKRG
jgi:hypothetical protein